MGGATHLSADLICGCSLQIEEESIKMAQFTEFRFVCVVGGKSSKSTCRNAEETRGGGHTFSWPHQLLRAGAPALVLPPICMPLQLRLHAFVSSSACAGFV